MPPVKFGDLVNLTPTGRTGSQGDLVCYVDKFVVFVKPPFEGGQVQITHVFGRFAIGKPI